METTSSQLLVPREMDSRMGRAAPTVVSYRSVTPFYRAAAFIAAYSTKGTESERRLEDTICSPAFISGM